jgi:hypothetical protein
MNSQTLGERQRKVRQQFSREEDQIISDLVSQSGACRWSRIAGQLPGRTPRQCRERWVNYLSPEVRRSPLSSEEEDLLRNKVAEHGQVWARIASFFEGRTDVWLKHQYLKLMRRDIKTTTRGLALRAPTPNSDPAPPDEESDLDGGAFWLNDEPGQHDWSLSRWDFQAFGFECQGWVNNQIQYSLFSWRSGSEGHSIFHNSTDPILGNMMAFDIK